LSGQKSTEPTVKQRALFFKIANFLMWQDSSQFEGEYEQGSEGCSFRALKNGATLPSTLPLPCSYGEVKELPSLIVGENKEAEEGLYVFNGSFTAASKALYQEIAVERILSYLQQVKDKHPYHYKSNEHEHQVSYFSKVTGVSSPMFEDILEGLVEDRSIELVTYTFAVEIEPEEDPVWRPYIVEKGQQRVKQRNFNLSLPANQTIGSAQTYYRTEEVRPREALSIQVNTPIDALDLLNLQRPGGYDFAKFMNALIEAHARQLDIKSTEVVTTLRTDVPDGGADAAVHGFASDSKGLLDKRTVWQFKATEKMGGRSIQGLLEALIRELVGPNAKKPRGKTIVEVEPEERYLSNRLREGYRYVVCLCKSLTAEQQDILRTGLTEYVQKWFGSNTPAVAVLGVEFLADWANQYPYVADYIPLRRVTIVAGQPEQKAAANASLPKLPGDEPVTEQQQIMTNDGQQPNNRLGSHDPASVFISYARQDEDAVLLLERALQLRGVRVVRDQTSLELGGHNVARLRELVNNGCDAILFYVTERLLNSDFIWRYEVPTALARWQRDPQFHIIPVLQGVSFGQLALHCADLGLTSLADFNAEKVADTVPSEQEVQTIAKRTLRSALALRRSRDEDRQQGLSICLRTFPYIPPTDRLHLDLDWSAWFDGNYPDPNVWHQTLLPALADVTSILAQQGRPNLVSVWLKARLPVAVALGHSFPPKGSLQLQLCTRQDTWAADGPRGSGFNFIPTRQPGEADNHVAIVEVAVSRDTSQDVTKWRKQNSITPRWRVRCVPPDGPSRDAITSPDQARALAQQLGDTLRQLWDREQVEDVHLFVASSTEFAALVGRQLVDRHRVHVYYDHNADGYRLAYTMNMEAH